MGFGEVLTDLCSEATSPVSVCYLNSGFVNVLLPNISNPMVAQVNYVEQIYQYKDFMAYGKRELPSHNGQAVCMYVDVCIIY